MISIKTIYLKTIFNFRVDIPSIAYFNKKRLSLLWPGASQLRIYYHRMWGQWSTTCTCSNATEVAQWGAPSCSRPQSATDNGVRDGSSNWLAVTPTLHRAVPPELHVLHGVNAGYKSQGLMQQTGSQHASVGMPGQRTACAATHGIISEHIYNHLNIIRICVFTILN